MKLSKFPYVVQKEILDHLSINSLFFLSLCSKKAKNFIKEIQMIQFKKFECFSYGIIKGFTWFRVKTVSSNNEVMCSYKPKDGIPEKVLSVPVEETRFNELGASIDFFCRPDDRLGLCLRHFSDNVESRLETIQNHFRGLFGNHIKCSWKCINLGVIILPMLPSVQTLEILEESALELSRLDEFLSKSTCLEHFSMSVPNIPIVKLRETSKIYGLDTIDLCISDGPLAKDIIKNFNGRHAFLRGGRITTEDVIQFLNTWKSGRKYRNLEVISMGGIHDDYNRRDNFNVREIRNSVEVKELNTEVVYSFIRKFQYLHRPQFETNLYMVRESDGHVASVSIQIFRVSLGVWNMTEEELLEKFR